MAISERELLQMIITSMREAGYDSYNQLYGYYTTGEESYITRKGDGREMIKNVSMETIRDFLRSSGRNI